jgi:hypothetical protein
MTEVERLKKRIEKLEKALWFYANPDTYYAVSFLFDPPCGGFRDDFGWVKWSDYNRKMPGKVARRALAGEISQMLKLMSTDVGGGEVV